MPLPKCLQRGALGFDPFTPPLDRAGVLPSFPPLSSVELLFRLASPRPGSNPGQTVMPLLFEARFDGG